MHKLSAIELKDLFVKGEISAEQIAKHTLNRIEKYDADVGSFLDIHADKMLRKAKELDAKKKSGQKVGSMAAIPVAIKDNINIKDTITTCASKFLTNYKAVFDASVCKFLEEEDALIIGKTNLDEFAMGSSTENSAFKKTKNPWNLTCTPGGSSGGSAAAVAARLCPLSLGSDTGGSIRQPAAFTGIVGFKPTYGRVSRYGLVAFASSLDQIGPFSTTVADTALIMQTISKSCPYDSTNIHQDAPDYLSCLQTASLKGKKIGVPWHFLEKLSEESKNNFNQAVEVFKSLGADIVNIDLDILKYSIAVYYVLATAEASANLARFDGIRYGVRSQKATNLEEVYEFSRQEGFGPEVKNRILLGTYVLSSGFKDAYYKKAQQVRTLMVQKFKEAFSMCSLVLMPTSPIPAFTIGEIQDPLQMYLQDIYTIAANLIGAPAISVPSGFNKNNMPLGIQIIGPQLHDKEVLCAAHSYEQATGHGKIIPSYFDNEVSK
ncbi:MAG: Asp-tRNA(Asn)/Glu-tRNA(Gln) amidotransferase subunit GatA [Chlamydiae bacterium]|nr:Asp-tRNA(Asn)/Glu-tRNA(Gln) amidotransferase subunit GatA [Chlamydiota bacterium]